MQFRALPRVLLVFLVAACFCTAFASSLTALSSPAQCTRVNPPPKNATCGVRGSVLLVPDDYQSGSPQIVQSLEECAALCARRRAYDGGSEPKAKNSNVICLRHTDMYYRPYEYFTDGFCDWCYGFEYSSKSKVCQLTGIAITNSNFSPNKRSPTVHFDPECFDCGSICDQKLGVQLLDNGDFEGQLLGPWDSVEGGTVVAHAGASDNEFVCDAAKGIEYPERLGGGSFCSLRQAFSICSYSLYHLQYSYKIPNATDMIKQVRVGFDIAPLDYYNGFVLHHSLWTTADSVALQHFSKLTNPAFSFINSFTSLTTYGKSETAPETHVSTYFRAPTFRTPAKALEFWFYQNSTTPRSALFSLSNVSVTRLPTFPTAKPGAHSVPLNGTASDQTLATTPGTAYLLSIAVEIGTTIYYGKDRRAVVDVEFYFADGRTTSSYDRYFYGRVNQSHSFVYRALTSRVQLSIIPLDAFYGVDFNITKLSFVEIADL